MARVFLIPYSDTKVMNKVYNWKVRVNIPSNGWLSSMTFHRIVIWKLRKILRNRAKVEADPEHLFGRKNSKIFGITNLFCQKKTLNCHFSNILHFGRKSSPSLPLDIPRGSKFFDYKVYEFPELIKLSKYQIK